MLILPPKREITKGRLGGKPFLYNPSSFKDNIRINYAEIAPPGISYPIPQYVGGELRTIEFTLYFNAKSYNGSSVVGSEYIKQWIAFLNNYLPKANSQYTKPKILEFAFGWFVKNTYLKSMITDYLGFTYDLQPAEANIDIILIIIQ